MPRISRPLGYRALPKPYAIAILSEGESVFESSVKEFYYSCDK